MIITYGYHWNDEETVSVTILVVSDLFFSFHSQHYLLIALDHLKFQTVTNNKDIKDILHERDDKIQSRPIEKKECRM